MKTRLTVILLLAIIYGCQKKTKMAYKFTNNLIHETSPYLLQHAHNPVNWNAWNDETLDKAKSNKKLIIISVGYAACHWCHVMEHESFEDEDVAKIMNDNYTNIKVDREERPDVDQVYMNAVQLMTGQGGWPMNVIALPDGRPVWGGTYFKKEQWIKVLNQISEIYYNTPEKLYEYADKLEQGITAMDLVSKNTNPVEFKISFIDETVKNWSELFDNNEGGLNRAPKFMMPNNYHFLLRYAYQNNNKNLQDYVNTTLTKMAFGGVYDQIGGGFSRYSTDSKWHIPHFEKMLYDNGQLVSLYSDAYLITKNELYKTIITETLEFIERELTTKEGAFYSSLDADSRTPEGKLEEGAFYVWKTEELKQLLDTDYNIFSAYYNVNDYGYWEHDNYVLTKTENDSDFVEKHGLTITEFNLKKQQWQNQLLKAREQRERPRLDDKTLTSWNALMLKGYIDAYRVLNTDTYLKTALKNAQFIINNQLREDGGLNHNYKNGTSSINGYLEDYATCIDAFITLYEVTLDEKWINTARDLTNYSFDHFFDANHTMFYFTSNQDKALVSRNMEYRDNVIPASNSIMAKNLFKLSHIFDNSHYYNTATSMLNNVKPEIKEYGAGYSNWLDLMLNYTQPFYEVAVVGNTAREKISHLNSYYIPNKITVGSTTDSNLPLLKNRYIDNETFIYVCVNKACKLPVSKVEDAIPLLKK